ncbi:hypothetical protein Peur_011505 [Populus x canadensis]
MLCSSMFFAANPQVKLAKVIQKKSCKCYKLILFILAREWMIYICYHLLHLLMLRRCVAIKMLLYGILVLEILIRVN